MTRYTPECQDGQGQDGQGQQREIDQQRQIIRRMSEEGIAAAARVVCMKSDLDAAARLVLGAGLTTARTATGHADTAEDLMREVLVQFAEVLVELASVKADRDEWKVLADHWISVADGYPETDGLYLCHFTDGTIETFDYQAEDADRRTWGVHNDLVTHWMPLPAPPSVLPDGDMK
jgi:hypothetical protein